MRQLIIIFSLIAMMFAPAIPLAAKSSDQAMEAQSGNTIPDSDIKRFVTSIAVIRHYYIKKVPDNRLFNDAISGMVSSLDPHSTFMDKDALKELSIATKGKFGGVGIEITPSNNMLKVITPLDDSPAAKAGIKPGDLIVAIDGVMVRNMSLDAAVKKIRGPRGSKVKLTILRKGEEKPITVTLKRKTIKLQAVKSRMLAPGFAYVRVAIFQGNVESQLMSRLKQLRKKSGGNIKGLVLDLRNNPGGLLDSGTDVANTFLDSKTITPRYKKLIVYTKGRAKGSQLAIHASGRDIIAGVPMVVLINGGSASASEIVAGALQDYDRAIIMGTRSFGKGSVQTVLPIDDNEAIKLTTALYYTPAGREIQARGIVPDVVVQPFSVTHVSNGDLKINEADLKDHLKNGQQGQQAQQSADVGLAKKDYQLYAALNMLRGIHALNR